MLFKVFWSDLPHTTTSPQKMIFFGIFFSDTTWFQGRLDFTVRTTKIQSPANNTIQFSNRFKQLWHYILDDMLFLQELIHFWSNPSVRLSNRLVLPFVSFVAYPCDLLVCVCQNGLIDTSIFFFPVWSLSKNEILVQWYYAS